MYTNNNVKTCTTPPGHEEKQGREPYSYNLLVSYLLFYGLRAAG
jgi:hypothetical protein